MNVPSDLDFKGTPRDFDEFLRTPMRVVQVVSGLVWTLPLIWLQWWWWLPIPMAVSFALYEYFFYARADRAISVQLRGLQALIRDRLLETERQIDLSTVHSAVLMHRRLDAQITEAVLALSSVDGPLLTLQFRLPHRDFKAHPRAIDGDLANGFLGAIAGMVRALAPREVILRQVIGDAKPLAWFYLNLPPAAWQRATVRVWKGAEPDLDLFGYHSQPHDGLLTLDERGVTWQMDGSSTTESLADLTVGSAMRTAVFFQMEGAEHSEQAEQLPLMLQRVGTQTVAIPAPLSPEIDPRATDDDLLHVHAPEGAVILWWLWLSIPQKDWPAPWSEGLREARVSVDQWPTSLPPLHQADGLVAEV